MTQIYNTKPARRGYSGYTADELTSRLSAVLEDKEIGDQVQRDFEQAHPKSYSKPEAWTEKEYNNFQKTNKFIKDNPLSNLPNDRKFEVMQAEYKKALANDKKARAQATEVIENKIQSQLKSMGIEPDYTYSIEYVREENEE